MLDLLTLLLSWQKEQPRTVEEEDGELSEGMSVDAAVHQTMEASRKESLQAFRSLVEQQQQ